MNSATAALELHVVAGPDSGRIAKLSAPDVLEVGRRHGNFLVSDGSVSRRHFRLFWRDNECFLNDLGSSNGTQVGGINQTEVRLENGDIITAGGSSFQVHFFAAEMHQPLSSISMTRTSEVTPSSTAATGPKQSGEPVLFSTLNAFAPSDNGPAPATESAHPTEMQDVVLEFGPWQLASLPGWEVVPDVGFHAVLDQGIQTSVILNDDELQEGQNLVDYLATQIKLMNGLFGESERQIEPIESAGFEEGLKLEQSLMSESGIPLNVSQVFLRTDQRIAIISCLIADAPLELLVPQLNSLISLLKLSFR